MERDLLLVEVISVIGLIFGILGFILGVLNYLRDQYKIIVTLNWDMTNADGKLLGVITVTNIGRRSSYVSHVALRLPKGYENTQLIIASSVYGKALHEGSSPEKFFVLQDNMEQYAKDWQNVLAQVSDSTGKEWVSKKIKTNQIPSWAKKDYS